jgi:hypothetical protein
MKEYIQDPTDIKTLIGGQTYQGHAHQEYDREALEVCGSEPLICFFCKLEITPDQTVNLHHPIYKSKGGTHVEPSHEACHVNHHSKQGDFKSWGRQSAQTRRWAFNLKNVKDNPAYEFDRAYYLMLYAG